MERKRITALAMLGVGGVAGAIIGTTVMSGAATTTAGSGTAAAAYGYSAPSTSAGRPANPNPGDPSKPQRSDETLLTGDTAAKVKALALGKYPGATVERVETDSDGVYEAHIVTSAGAHVIVQVGADFTITGTQEQGHR